MTPLDELRAEVGPAALLGPGDDLDRYQRPARGAPGRAAFVARPASVDEVRAVVRWAYRHRIRLVAQGANSGLVGASVPDGSGAVGVLSLERMTAGLLVDPVDRTAIVPAGLHLSALEAALEPHGLTFPIDLGADPTIGGMAATNTGGSRVLAYGDVRRRVLGIEAVVADEDATVLDLLTTLRKDNSRLALHQLFVGSSGALGVITKVAVELAPLPAARATWWIVPSSDDAVPRLLAHVEREAGPALTAFELLSAGAFAATGSALFAPPPDTVLLVELSGDERVDELFERVLASVPDGVMVDARSVPAATSWAIRHAVSEGLRRQGEVVGLDVSTPRSEVLALRAEARQMVAARFPGGVLCEFGHMGDGSLHLNVVFAGGATDGDKDRLRAAIHDLVRGHHGSFSAEHGIGPFNADQWRASTPPAVQRATAQLVRLFDPRGVLGHPGLPFRDEVTSP